MKFNALIITGLAALAVFFNLTASRVDADQKLGEICVLEVQKLSPIIKSLISCDGRETEVAEAGETRDLLRELSLQTKKLEDAGLQLVNCELFQSLQKEVDTLPRPKKGIIVPNAKGEFPPEQEAFYPSFQRCIFRAK